MNIVYAAEKPTIARVLSEHLCRDVAENDIDVQANPDETGSFLINWNIHSYVMAPDGSVADSK